MPNSEVIDNVIEAINENRNDWGFDMKDWMITGGDESRNAFEAYDGQISLTEFVRMGKRPKHNCGTTFCIAGWTVALYPNRGKKHTGCMSMSNRASYILGIDAEDGFEVFHAVDKLQTKLKATRALELLKHGANGDEAILWAQSKRQFQSGLKALERRNKAAVV